MQQLLVGPFGRMVQACAGVLERRDGTEQEIAADGGGEPAVLIQTYRMITAPDFAPAGTLENGTIKLNDRALKGLRQRRPKRHNAEWECVRCGQPSAQVGRFHICNFELACGVEDTLGGCGGRGSVMVSDAHSCVLTSF